MADRDRGLLPAFDGSGVTKRQIRIVPCTAERAREYVATLHRHHTPDTTRTRWALAAADSDGDVRGIALVGYPVARFQDDGWTLEVQRVATDGCDNACSALYGAAARMAKALGFHRVITYIREDEPGITLRAAGWIRESDVAAGSWSRPNIGRVRTDKTELVGRTRWGITFAAAIPVELKWPYRQPQDQLSVFPEDVA